LVLQDSTGITILEDSLAITIEPFAGWLSDKQRHQKASEKPLALDMGKKAAATTVA
jgi:hypothetical protein